MELYLYFLIQYFRDVQISSLLSLFEDLIWIFQSKWVEKVGTWRTCEGEVITEDFLLAYLFTYLLTYSMEQSPSWEVNRFSASQDFHAFYGTRRFIAAYTNARHLSLSWELQKISP